MLKIKQYIAKSSRLKIITPSTFGTCSSSSCAWTRNHLRQKCHQRQRKNWMIGDESAWTSSWTSWIVVRAQTQMKMLTDYACGRDDRPQVLVDGGAHGEGEHVHHELVIPRSREADRGQVEEVEDRTRKRQREARVQTQCFGISQKETRPPCRLRDRRRTRLLWQRRAERSWSRVQRGLNRIQKPKAEHDLEVPGGDSWQEQGSGRDRHRSKRRTETEACREICHRRSGRSGPSSHRRNWQVGC